MVCYAFEFFKLCQPPVVVSKEKLWQKVMHVDTLPRSGPWTQYIIPIILSFEGDFLFSRQNTIYGVRIT